MISKFNISDDSKIIEGSNEISKVNATVLLLHGTNDSRVDLKLKKEEIEFFEKNKISCEPYFYENSGHYVVCDEFHDTLKRMKVFLVC